MHNSEKSLYNHTFDVFFFVGNISSDADTTSNKTDRDVNSLISTLSTLGEQISDTMTMDNELKALMERVRRAQILRGNNKSDRLK